ncbi:hypothetical protein [Algoriphagus sp. PAP.12]|uniref:hypothetical protein n=1 Tax=Algoriphagus sp. PAP.12 TaxID=2996678 RepID=UPI00227B3189|nr:hypothetical protein [Algoriphagus sp. PAP.12]
MFKNLFLRIFTSWLCLTVGVTLFTTAQAMSSSEEAGQNVDLLHPLPLGHTLLDYHSSDLVQSYVKTYYTPQQDTFWEVEEEKERDFITIKRLPVDFGSITIDWISELWGGLMPKSKSYFDLPVFLNFSVPLYILKQVFII